MAAGCSTTSNSGTASSSSQVKPKHASNPLASAMSAATAFGPACSSIPKSGTGSFSSLAGQSAGTAISHISSLSTLSRAISTAGLTSRLNSAPSITIFAPDNSAFSKLPAGTLGNLLRNRGELARTLTYHVVRGRLSPSQLPGTHTTQEGATLRVTGSGQNFTVNGTAKVVCGDVRTRNAVIYIIDSVLRPPAGGAGGAASPSPSPSGSPTTSPTASPTASPTRTPTSSPTSTRTSRPTTSPS
jgi:uncharacterized surface protein with fasciclin (FAS1) repeats